MSISSDSCDGYQELTKTDDHEEPRLEEIISIHSSESSAKRKETKHVAVRQALNIDLPNDQDKVINWLSGTSNNGDPPVWAPDLELYIQRL